MTPRTRPASAAGARDGGSREEPPTLAMGSSKPLPLLTGCCRTTSWEASRPRRCGSCGACSHCESRPCPARTPTPPNVPTALRPSPLHGSWPQALWGSLVVRVCMRPCACPLGSKAPGCEDWGNGPSLGGRLAWQEGLSPARGCPRPQGFAGWAWTPMSPAWAGTGSGASPGHLGRSCALNIFCCPLRASWTPDGGACGPGPGAG